MRGFSVVRLVNPWGFKREQERQRLAALRERDGDDCRRCRRPMRFDLPRGHDQAPRLEPIGRAASADSGALDDLCLCHTRCNAQAGDNTAEVQERLQRRAEAGATPRKARARTRKAA